MEALPNLIQSIFYHDVIDAQIIIRMKLFKYFARERKASKKGAIVVRQRESS